MGRSASRQRIEPYLPQAQPQPQYFDQPAHIPPPTPPRRHRTSCAIPPNIESVNVGSELRRRSGDTHEPAARCEQIPHLVQPSAQENYETQDEVTSPYREQTYEEKLASARETISKVGRQQGNSFVSLVSVVMYCNSS